jgi:hypothetical protein
MSTAMLATPTDLDRFLEVIWRPGDVREARILTPRGTDSGYFDDPRRLAAAVAPYDGRHNVYLTLNPVAPALLARAANRIRPGSRSTTADRDVLERRWLPIDIDPVRPADISASEAERELALQTARDVYGYLRERGWPDPVTAMSGNGYWLLYPVELPNDEASKRVVEGVLRHLAERFGTPRVGIDTSVSNASRIVALVGTLKVKGDATPDRPHRRSALSFCPPELVPVPVALLEELAPVPAVPRAAGTITVTSGERMPAGWVRTLLDSAGIQYRETQRGGCTWYRLEQCPFHPDDDRGGDCGVGEDANGKGLGHCFHNRGQGAGWREFRTALGLPAPAVAPPSVAAAPRAVTAAIPPAVIDAADLLALDIPPLQWIVPNLIPEGTTILAGPPKLGKSCFVYQVAVEVALGGSLLDRDIAAGEVLYLALEDGRRRGQTRLRAALEGRAMPHGRLQVQWSSAKLGEGLEEEITGWLDAHPEARLVAIDTLQKVRARGDSRRNAYEVDVEDLGRLQGLFRDRAVGLLVVHHSKKDKGDDFLASVSGTYGITGSADTTLVIARKRGEPWGTIHVTGRDVEEVEEPVQFNGLTWSPAPRTLVLGSVEQAAVYRAVLDHGEPIGAAELARLMGRERKSTDDLLQKLRNGGALVKVLGGYTVPVRITTEEKEDARTNEVLISSGSSSLARARTRVKAVPPSYSSSAHTREAEEAEEAGTHAGTHAGRRARTREADPPRLVAVDPGTWVEPCLFYADHRDHHHWTAAGWRCRICTPEEDPT